MPDKRVLITGIRGFTGEYLAEELQVAGLQVFGTARPDESISDHIYRSVHNTLKTKMKIITINGYKVHNVIVWILVIGSNKMLEINL